ncbi:MAG: peptidylprolyl isomerase [Bacteroidetes bacterium]|nr:peptidylprolyl isomerase [Bacteroidota bacterium]MBL7103094.1 peptidylprolyl isomerase [Bacteroidales bacterium]
MNFLRYLILGIGIFLVVSMNAQENRALVTIAGEDITVDEFMYVYKKNNTQGDVIDKKSVQEYLDLYINFRLKVKEAEELGYDTVTAFKEELAGYREQLAEPYFVNEDIIEDLLVEAYERKKEDIRVSHILLMIGPNAMPEDTLDAYFKIMEARERIEAGESFAEVAKDVSEDPSARDRISPRGGRIIPGNGGDLGYFTVFDMVYPFETGAFNTAVGEMSMPVRTDFGYHIIKVTDRIPALGTMAVAHLYLKMPDSATAQDSTDIRLKIDSLYQRIQEGDSYEDLVKEYSDDKGSSGSGGLLPKFEVNRMVPEFIEVINTLQDSGDVSKPILTAYGWHIIKLYEKTGIMPFEEVENDMRKRLEKDRRAQKSEDIIISDIKNEYGFTLNEKAIREICDIIDSTIFIGKWEVPEDIILKDVVFTLDDQTYSQKQFADYIAANQDISSGENINEFVNRKFKQFTDEECKAYEDSRLEEKHPDFKAIMKEYRDGILLFELTNNKIWSFATKDTTGLKEYYDKHKKEFLWDTRLDASIYTFNDTNYIEATRELIINGKSEDEILTEINKDTLDIVRIEHKKFQKEDNDLIDSIKWKKGIIDNMEHGGRTVFIVVHKKIAPEPKSFNEARGLITAGYQEYLEEKWIKELRAKYPVEIHKEVLSSLTN